MASIEIYCRGSSARAKFDGDITAGYVGLKVKFHLDDAWQGLAVTGYARCGDIERVIVPDSDGNGIVPWECLVSGRVLEIGAMGVADGGVKIPTVWAKVTQVLPSTAEASAANPAPAPSPTQVEQITQLAQDADRKAQDVLTRADNHAFDGDDYVLTDADRAEIAGRIRPYVDGELQKVRGELEELADTADGKYSMPPAGIPEADLDSQVRQKLYARVYCTRAEYDSIAVPDPDTDYFIMED